MSAHSVARRRITPAQWSFLQWAVLVVGVVHIVWAIVGWIAEPSFGIGEHAHATPVAGMDYNGWHAVAGLLLFTPALLAATRKSWSAWYCLAAGLGGGLVVGVWALFSERVLIFTFPNHTTDAIMHLLTGALLLALVAVQVARDGDLRETLGLRAAAV
ncbi:DUF4383 domain-containing protein [Nocardia huaxiensis]|uniref:DUF4383 domain-containing protein n=1 Tax=Nocardia huaxiensis TaxID=2755382 RepID=A0A7D6VEX5_9NOCA|nr:DUF4383 domain-containing protein [Nocardia huaxiensis]QLY33771.1 DUF4383 domain-containing protein [Nocardia huaxiensis]UFS99304.1 DUF4383 domain-containing protein [Nocardia huaxiensis]